MDVGWPADQVGRYCPGMTGPFSTNRSFRSLLTALAAAILLQFISLDLLLHSPTGSLGHAVGTTGVVLTGGASVIPVSLMWVKVGDRLDRRLARRTRFRVRWMRWRRQRPRYVAMLSRVRAQARADFTARRDLDRLPIGSSGSSPRTWDDLSASLERALLSLNHAPVSLVRQVDAELRRSEPVWRRQEYAIGLDLLLDPNSTDPRALNHDWQHVAGSLDRMVFSDLYSLPWQNRNWIGESLWDLRFSHGASDGFAAGWRVPYRWDQRLRIVQVTAALEAQRYEQIDVLDAATRASGTTGYAAFDEHRGHRTDTFILKPELAGWVARRPRTAREIAEHLSRSIPWLDDIDQSEQRLDEVMTVPITPPAMTGIPALSRLEIAWRKAAPHLRVRNRWLQERRFRQVMAAIKAPEPDPLRRS